MDNRPDCPFCNLPSALIIKRLKHWTVTLNTNQTLLGRCIIVHNTHTEDPMDTDEEERKELWDAADMLHDILNDLFEPDLINYAFLDNTDRHVKLHVIPRYAVPRKWSGLTFDDHWWGGPPWPGEKRELGPELLKKMLDEMVAALG